MSRAPWDKTSFPQLHTHSCHFILASAFLHLRIPLSPRLPASLPSCIYVKNLSPLSAFVAWSTKQYPANPYTSMFDGSSKLCKHGSSLRSMRTSVLSARLFEGTPCLSVSGKPSQQQFLDFPRAPPSFLTQQCSPLLVLQFLVALITVKYRRLRFSKSGVLNI